MERTAVLKWALAQLNKKIEERPAGKIKTKIDGEERVIPYTQMQEELERLVKASEEDRLKLVVFCNECSAYTGGAKAPRGCCFKKEFTSGRLGKDFCSLYEINGVQQRRGLY